MFSLTPRTARSVALILALTAVALPLAAQATTSTAPGVAILDFDNGALVRDMDYGPLGKGIADMLITDLAASRAIRLVDREHLQKVLEEQGLAEARRVDPQTAVQLGKLVGARYFLTGGFMVNGRGDMVLNVRIVNTETSEVPWAEKVEGKAVDVFNLISELGQRINTSLKLPPLPASGTRSSGVSVQDQYRAFHLVSKSIEEQDKKNYRAAISLVRQALDIYPGYQRAEVRLAALQKIGSSPE